MPLSGGCTVTLVQKSAVEALEKALKSAYKAKFNKETTIFLTTPGQGAGTVALQTKEEKDRNTMLLVVLGTQSDRLTNDWMSAKCAVSSRPVFWEPNG
jgi:hypothetical protein